jgi:hypothetical protein
MKQIKLLLLTAMISACATTHPGNMAKSVNNNKDLPLIVSAETVDGDLNGAFQLVDITFENGSDKWIKVNSAHVVLETPSDFSVVTGPDLQDWGKAMSFEINKQQHNKAVAENAILIGGTAAAVVGSKTNNPGLTTAGALVTLGVFGWAVADVVNSSYSKATQAGTFPENHLSHPFSVPGKLFMRRWVLLNKPSKSMLKKLVIEVETITGEKDTYEVAI